MQRGFTLPEVLITLGIIGVVAAMTIPTLLQKNYEKRTVTQLRATQAILTQALRMAEEEYGTMDGWAANPRENSATTILYADKLKPFLKLALDCGVSDTKGKCIYNGAYKLKNGKFTANHSTISYYYKVKLLNGSSVWWRPNTTMNSRFGTLATANFFIDTNGAYGPNIWGTDLFEFIYYPGRGLIAEGSPGSNYEYKTHCLDKNATGYGCAYYVLNFQNMNYLHKK